MFVVDVLVADSPIFTSISSDKVGEDDNQEVFKEEFLNSLTPCGLPPHVLPLLVGIPVMSLRNLYPADGACYGSRLMVKNITRGLVEATVMTGPKEGTTVFIHRVRRNSW